MKRPITVAFYKNPTNTLYDKFISYKTKSPYTRVEIIIDGLWYGASYDDKCVRIEGITSDFSQWEFIELYLHPLDIDVMIEFIKLQVGKSCDIHWVFGYHPYRDRLIDQKSWFSSELVYEALKYGGIRLENCSYFVTPKMLYKFISDIK